MRSGLRVLNLYQILPQSGARILQKAIWGHALDFTHSAIYTKSIIYIWTPWMRNRPPGSQILSSSFPELVPSYSWYIFIVIVSIFNPLIVTIKNSSADIFVILLRIKRNYKISSYVIYYLCFFFYNLGIKYDITVHNNMCHTSFYDTAQPVKNRTTYK